MIHNSSRSHLIYGGGAGYILGQIDPQGSETVIEYGGRAYRGAEQNYSITHKEGLALVTAVKGRVNALRLKPFFSSNIMPEASDVSTCDPAGADQFDSEPTPVPANLTPHVPAPVTVPQPVAVGSPGQAGDFYIVERLLGSFVKQGTRYFKVKWKGYKERTWEPAENIPDELIADYYSRKRIKK